MKPKNYTKNGKIYIWGEIFAVVKSKKSISNSFAIIKDKKETTSIINQNKVKNKDIIKIDKNWKIITFKTVLPFNLVGFIRRISEALTKEKISVLVISSYSTDHILVKKTKLKKTIKILKNLGFKEK